MPFQAVLSTSVPTHDADFVTNLLTGSETIQVSLQNSNLRGVRLGVRVLTLTIHDRLDAAHLDALPDLEAVITRSDGHDHLPLDLLRERGVAAYHLEGYATQSVARLALTLLLGALRRVPESNARLHQGPGAWTRDPFVGREPEDVTIGIVGAGRIGGALARLLHAVAPQARILAFDPVRDAELDPFVSWTDTLDALLRRSDAVSLHLPLTDDTRNLLDADRLALLPPGAVLINTARGAIVDQEAVETALRAGRLGGYAADVLPGEPDPPDLDRFMDLPNAVLTPHLGAHNEATLRRRWESTAAIARAILAGEPAAVSDYRIA